MHPLKYDADLQKASNADTERAVNLLGEGTTEGQEFPRNNPRKVSILQFGQRLEAIHVESLVVEVAQGDGAAHGSCTVQYGDREGVNAEPRVAEGDERWVDSWAWW